MRKKTAVFLMLMCLTTAFVFMNYTGCCPPPKFDQIKRADYAPVPVKYPNAAVFQITKKENAGGYDILDGEGNTLRSYLESHPVVDEKGKTKIYHVLKHLEAGKNTPGYFLNLTGEIKKEDIPRYKIFWGIDSRIGKKIKRINKRYDVIVLVQHDFAFALYRYKLDDEGNFAKDSEGKLIFDNTPGVDFQFNSLVMFKSTYVMTKKKK